MTLKVNNLEVKNQTVKCFQFFHFAVNITVPGAHSANKEILHLSKIILIFFKSELSVIEVLASYIDNSSLKYFQSNYKTCLKFKFSNPNILVLDL